jgi:predicted kinase
VADQEAQAVRDRRTLTLTLIVVSGAPGTGKSTIANALGAALRFPVLSLDPVKEALADVLGLGDEDWSNRVGDAAAEVVFRLASAFPDAVAEGFELTVMYTMEEP